MNSIFARVRKDARITQEKLAKALNKSIITIKRWEKGNSEPGFSDIRTAVRLFDLDILRYMIDDNDSAELCDRGFGKYVLKLEQGLYVDHDLLQAFVERDWIAAKQIHENSITDSLATNIWSKINQSPEQTLDKWGKNPSDAALRAYCHFIEEKSEGILESGVLKKLTIMFRPAFRTTINRGKSQAKGPGLSL